MAYDKEVIEKTKDYVRKTLEGEGSGHDWWHIQRVCNNAISIGRKESGDLYVIELAALLHDIADYKFHGGDFSVGPRVAREHLICLNVDEEIINHVCDIIADLSFKGAGAEKPMKTIEGKSVRDADRLDAIGAIGIARCFAYGGHKNMPIHLPDIKPELHKTVEEYVKRQSSQINHFYEKLLLLKDLMTTNAGRKMAEKRHEFMELYLDKFFKEWEGEE